jgi:hypothetical protein
MLMISQVTTGGGAGRFSDLALSGRKLQSVRGRRDSYGLLNELLTYFSYAVGHGRADGSVVGFG